MDLKEAKRSLEDRLSMLGVRVTRLESDLRNPGSRDWTDRASEKENEEVLERLNASEREEIEQIRAAHAPSGSPSLVPADPALKEQMERWIDASSLSEDPIRYPERSIGNAVPRLTLQLFAAMIEKIPYRNILEGLLFHFDRRRPLLFLTLKACGVERMRALKPVMRMLAVGREHVKTHLDALETQLAQSGGPWILGPGFSLADVSWLVIFERLRQVDNEHVFLGGGLRPACTAYWERLKGRPSYAEAILGYPHPLIDHGIQRLKQAKAADPALRKALEGSPG